MSRIYTVVLSDGESFYHRMSLLHFKGAAILAKVSTVNGVHYRCFREACKECGLFADVAE